MEQDGPRTPAAHWPAGLLGEELPLASASAELLPLPLEGVQEQDYSWRGRG